ncbi:DUF1848 domain-containing protein [Desulfosarcina sp. OttesenSCG-928-A07]|nr:DUF1848 domain-containing protein [Desulfosarcina sp. OttesenSCG-928-A07]
MLSISRRTDIPAFYMEGFMAAISRRLISVENPYTRKVRQIPVTPDEVHTLVFWSKNFGPFLDARHGETLKAMGYHVFFQFTVNSGVPDLEPGVPPLDQRLEQFGELSRRFGPETVAWRFDPICHFFSEPGKIRNNLGDFDRIARSAADAGIRTCVASFMDLYPKIIRRSRGKLTFIDLPAADKITLVLDLERRLMPLGIHLALCCENAVANQLPLFSTVRSGACVSGKRIMDRYGGSVSQRADTGQRRGRGCGCTKSVDVGSYRLHPCLHNCLYCYANPADGKRGGS